MVPARAFHADGQLTEGEFRTYGPFANAQGAVLAQMTGEGDADLYMRRGEAPTPDAYDCRPYSGGADEQCEGTESGDWYVAVRGYSSAPTFDLNIQWQGEVDADMAAHADDDEWHRYDLSVPAGERLVLRSEAPSDIDLYVRFAHIPHTSEYDLRAYSGSGNEELIVEPVDYDRTVYFGVFGYSASDFILTAYTE